MLPRDSFFRNAPRVFDLDSRLRWEIIVNASDSVSLSYSRLLKTLETVSSLNLKDEDSEVQRSCASVDCWSIVDHTHALVQILKRFPRKQEGQLDSFLGQFQKTVFKMRNGRSHISQNINNITIKKTLKYIFFDF